ncbi:MAG TPA: hypothetical protein VM387_07560 [Gemmatimonadales bacterium]|nr:hypothetical protein [Gemmatimonadales bacterium]
MTDIVGPDAYVPSAAEVEGIIARRLTRGKPGPTPRQEQVAITRRLFDQVITAAWALSLRGQNITAAAVHGELPKGRGKNAIAATPVQVASILESEMGRKALSDRGLQLHDEQELTYEMVATIRALMDPRNLSHTQRLRIAGVSESQYQGFLSFPKFRQTLQEGTEVALKGGIAEANAALMRQVQKGDLKAVQYLHSLTGYYDPNKQSAMDMQTLLSEIQTVMFKHVTDPAALMAIAAEMQVLMGRLEMQDSMNQQALPAGAAVDMAALTETLGGVPSWDIPAEALAGLDTEEAETPSTTE